MGDNGGDEEEGGVECEHTRGLLEMGDNDGDEEEGVERAYRVLTRGLLSTRMRTCHQDVLAQSHSAAAYPHGRGEQTRRKTIPFEDATAAHSYNGDVPLVLPPLRQEVERGVPMSDASVAKQRGLLYRAAREQRALKSGELQRASTVPDVPLRVLLGRDGEAQEEEEIKEDEEEDEEEEEEEGRDEEDEDGDKDEGGKIGSRELSGGGATGGTRRQIKQKRQRSAERNAKKMRRRERRSGRRLPMSKGTWRGSQNSSNRRTTAAMGGMVSSTKAWRDTCCGESRSTERCTSQDLTERKGQILCSEWSQLIKSDKGACRVEEGRSTPYERRVETARACSSTKGRNAQSAKARGRVRTRERKR